MDSLNQQKIEAMMAKGTEAQLDAWKAIDDRFDVKTIKAEKERVAKELAEITGKASGEAIAKELDRGGGGGGTSGGTPPPAGLGPPIPPRTGRGRGNYPGGQIGFGRPSAQTPP